MVTYRSYSYIHTKSKNDITKAHTCFQNLKCTSLSFNLTIVISCLYTVAAVLLYYNYYLLVEIKKFYIHIPICYKWLYVRHCKVCEYGEDVADGVFEVRLEREFNACKGRREVL